MLTAAEKAKYFPDEKVTLMPVPRVGAMIDDPKHVAYFMYPDTKVIFTIPYDINNHRMVEVLNDEERKVFEKVLGVDLNIHTKPKADNFWLNFYVTIQKNDTFMEQGYTFNMSNPLENLSVRILKVFPTVAPSWEDRYESGEYRFALVKEGYKQEQQNKRAEQNLVAYPIFSKMSASSQSMYDFLCVYHLKGKLSKRPSETLNKEAYQGQIQEILDNDMEGFIAITGDPEYTNKLKVSNAIQHGFIIRDFHTHDYRVADTKAYLGKNIDEVVANIKTPDGQAEWGRVVAMLEQKA